MVVGISVPRPIHLERARRLTSVGVAQVRCDAAVLVLQFDKWIEGIGQRGDRRVQPAAWDDEQREAGAGLLVVDANLALLIEPASLLFLGTRGSLCAEYPGRGRRGGRRRARFQQLASG